MRKSTTRRPAGTCRWLLCLAVLFWQLLPPGATSITDPVVREQQQEGVDKSSSCTLNATSRTSGVNEANNKSTCSLMGNNGKPDSTLVEVDMPTSHCTYTTSSAGRVIDLTAFGASARYGFSSAKAGLFDLHAAELTGCGIPFCFVDDFGDNSTECTVVTVVQPNQPCMITKCKAGYGTCTNQDPRACTTLRCNNGEAELRVGDDGPKGELAFTCQPCRQGYFNTGESHRCTECKQPSCKIHEDVVPCTGERDAHCKKNDDKVGYIAFIVVGTTGIYVLLSVLCCCLRSNSSRFRWLTDKIGVVRQFEVPRANLPDRRHGFFGLCVACGQPDISRDCARLAKSAEQLTRELAQWGYLMSYPVLSEYAARDTVLSALEAVATNCKLFAGDATVILVIAMPALQQQLSMDDVLGVFPQSTNILVLLDACYSGAAYTERPNTIITAASVEDTEVPGDGKWDFMNALHDLVGRGQAKVQESVSAMGLSGSIAKWCQVNGSNHTRLRILQLAPDFDIHSCSKSCGRCPTSENLPVYSLPGDQLERYMSRADDVVGDVVDDDVLGDGANIPLVARR